LPTDVEKIHRELTLDAQGRIAEDLPCRACGYNLRGHARDALCPECSTPVSLSARSDLLRFSDPDWIERLAKGMRLILIGLIASAVLQTAVAVISIALTTVGTTVFTALMGTAGLLGAGISVIVVVGVWWLTTPDPARSERERAVSIRRLTRGCLMVQVAAAPLQVGSPAAGAGVPGAAVPTGWFLALTVAGIGLWLVVLVGYGAGFVYLRRLALRVPRPPLARQTKIVMWGYLSSQGLAMAVGMIFLFVLAPTIATAGATMTGGLVAYSITGCAVAVGSLVFGIWALVLLFRYAALFKHTASDAREAWAR
jgi:hypothetical protein